MIPNRMPEAHPLAGLPAATRRYEVALARLNLAVQLAESLDEEQKRLWQAMPRVQRDRWLKRRMPPKDG